MEKEKCRKCDATSHRTEDCPFEIDDTFPREEKNPFLIFSWQDLEMALAIMKPRSKLYNIVKAELQKRGNWKNAPRGVWAKKPPKS